eukprot:6452626-Pyramimonas_sp.AAC.1
MSSWLINRWLDDPSTKAHTDTASYLEHHARLQHLQWQRKQMARARLAAGDGEGTPSEGEFVPLMAVSYTHLTLPTILLV